nr:GATA transcription factor 11-like [Ipomoea trifida]
MNRARPAVGQSQTKRRSLPVAHARLRRSPSPAALPPLRTGIRSLPKSVRYRTGRLFPEYRPANSPTFVPTLHFSSHRKVVEMRRKGVGGGFCKERCRGREEEYGRGQKVKYRGRDKLNCLV